MYKVYSAPFDVRFVKNGEDAIYTVVQPDICMICDSKKLDEKGCLGVPDWIIEITSPSTAKKNLNEKFNLYESLGVKEYWVVFPKDRYILVYLLNDKGMYKSVGNFENNEETSLH